MLQLYVLFPNLASAHAVKPPDGTLPCTRRTSEQKGGSRQPAPPRNTLAQRSEPVVRKPASASVTLRIPALPGQGTPVEQGAVQRSAGVGVHTELAVLCQKWRGCSACRLCHPQHFVHVVVVVRACASKDNEHVVDLLQRRQHAGAAASSPRPATSVVPRRRRPPRTQTRDPLARQQRTRPRMTSLWR